jgi:DNA-binding response OmpR family regulator
MKMLIAEDDPVSRRVLEATLSKWGHEVVVGRDGGEAWKLLQSDDAPLLAILDWMMPEMDGLEVIRRIREKANGKLCYIIVLTARASKDDVALALDAGADDYIVKPFDAKELRARINAGMRIVDLQEKLALRVRELEEALGQVNQLRGLLPICAWCHKIRDDQNYWQTVESYFSAHSQTQFTHGICPDCFDRVTQTGKK